MSELLPCPFCGGEAEVLTAESMNGGYLFGAMCNDCLSRGDVYDTEAEAVEAWNTRAVRTCNIVYDNGIAHCDTCGAGTYTGSNLDYWHYCPNCGAKVVDK